MTGFYGALDKLFNQPHNIKFIYDRKENNIYLTSKLIEREEEVTTKNTASTKIKNGSIAFDLFHLINEKEIDLSSLVEAQFIKEHFDETGGKILKNKNEVRKRLSINLVRNASSRIFSDPLRSFLEIVVNAGDALNESKKFVGKFGLGFFSILSFLSNEETGKSDIVLKSCYEIENGELYAYEAIFSKNASGTIQVYFRKLDPSNLFGSTGTMIEIYPKQKFFSEKTLKNLKKYLHYLDFYEGAPISCLFYDEISDEISVENIGKNRDKNLYNHQRIHVRLLPRVLSVQDFGPGISLETLFSNLLIPSSSSKEQIENFDEKKATEAQLVEFKGKNDEKTSHFLISVNGVVAVNKVLPEPIYDLDGHAKDILVSMPQSTKLTLSRDEIDFSDYDNSFEENFLKDVIDSTIERINCKNFNPKVLLALYHGLKTMERQSATSHIVGLFTRHFKKTFNELLDEKDNLIPVPQEFYTNFVGILDKNSEHQLIPIEDDLVDSNYEKLENFLKKYFEGKIAKEKNPTVKQIIQLGLDGKIIEGMHLFFVPPEHLPQTVHEKKSRIVTLGLRTSIFVTTDLIKNNLKLLATESILNNVSNEIINLSTDRKLIPHRKDWTKEIEDLNQNQKNDLLWAISREKELKHALDDLNLRDIVTDISKLYEMGKEKGNALNERPALLFSKLRESVLGLYDRYFDIPDHLFPRPYGCQYNKKLHVMQSRYDADIQIVYEFLQTFQKNERNFKRLIDFQIEDFKFQTRKSARNENINHRYIYVPTIFANTPISVLATLWHEEVDIDVLNTIVKETKSTEELMFCISQRKIAINRNVKLR